MRAFLKNVFSQKGAVGLAICLVGIWLIHNALVTREHNAQMADAKRPKQPLAQTNPSTVVNPAVAQPAVIADGKERTGLNYHANVEQPIVIEPEATPQPKVEDLPPMVLCDFPVPTPTPSPTPSAPKAQRLKRWLPRGVYFRVETQGALMSSHMDTPVQVKVTEDVYQWDGGRSELIIPAGTRCSAWATQGYTRDRLEVKGDWIMVFPTNGFELEFTGILCEQEFDPQLNQFGKFDKTAGLLGKLIESDGYVRLKAALGLVLQTAADSASSFASSALQTSMRGGTSVSYNVPSTTPFTNEWIEQLVNGHHTAINDTLYVLVPSGHQGWIFTTSVIDPDVASIGARIQEEEKARKQREEQQYERTQSPVDAVLLKRLQQPAEQTQIDPLSNEQKPVSAAHFN
jgi:hypothetical protein